ncbi:MAG: hypothetical protein IJF92_03265 [Bacilli bacterium]|nr:hypothetical protein [Bacilli bacterium]
MKIEIIDKDSVYFFINSMYISNIDLNSKEDIISFVKKLIIKYHKKLNMKGFYKAIVYTNKKVGLFIEVSKIDDSLYMNSLDLKIIVNMNEKVYFKTKEYNILPNNKKYYYNKYFYCDVSSVNKIIDIVDYGVFIYGNELDNIRNKLITI